MLLFCPLKGPTLRFYLVKPPLSLPPSIVSLIPLPPLALRSYSALLFLSPLRFLYLFVFSLMLSSSSLPR